jgi:hypothetical protein
MRVLMKFYCILHENGIAKRSTRTAVAAIVYWPLV